MLGPWGVHKVMAKVRTTNFHPRFHSRVPKSSLKEGYGAAEIRPAEGGRVWQSSIASGNMQTKETRSSIVCKIWNFGISLHIEVHNDPFVLIERLLSTLRNLVTSDCFTESYSFCPIVKVEKVWEPCNNAREWFGWAKLKASSSEGLRVNLHAQCLLFSSIYSIRCYSTLRLHFKSFHLVFFLSFFFVYTVQGDESAFKLQVRRRSDKLCSWLTSAGCRVSAALWIWSCKSFS